jgi:hypothetical protein
LPLLRRADPPPQQFALPKVLCLHFVFCLKVETEPIVACPGCMRWYITKFLLCNLITANVLWPVVSLLPSLYFLAMTFRKGHSSGL